MLLWLTVHTRQGRGAIRRRGLVQNRLVKWQRWQFLVSFRSVLSQVCLFRLAWKQEEVPVSMAEGLRLAVVL